MTYDEKIEKLPQFLIVCIALFISVDIYLYIPCFLILLLIMPHKSILISKQVTLLTLGIIFYLLLFLTNKDNLALTQPEFTIFRYIFLILIAYYLSSFEKNKYIFSFLFSLCVFVLLSSYITIIYSYILFKTQGINLGYGFLFNPIHSIYVKSPKIALYMLVSTATLVLLPIKTKKTAVIIIIIGLILSIYIQSRTTFILLCFLLVLKSYYIFKSNINSMLMITFIIAVVITLLLILNTQLIHIIPDIEDSRVTTSILESKRFLLWADGSEKMLLNPLGNFSTNHDLDDTDYFHNIILDSAKIYGWPSFILLLSFFSFTLLKVIEIKRLDILFLFVIYILIMSQDVVIEGNFQIFLITYITTIILHKITIANRVANH